MGREWRVESEELRVKNEKKEMPGDEGRLQNFVDGLSLYLEDSVRERNFEWNLAFASDEVIEGLEKMCGKEAYPYTKEETEGETRFHVTLPDGNVTLCVRSQAAQYPPFNAIFKFQRTMLLVSVKSPW